MTNKEREGGAQGRSIKHKVARGEKTIGSLHIYGKSSCAHEHKETDILNNLQVHLGVGWAEEWPVSSFVSSSGKSLPGLGWTPPSRGIGSNTQNFSGSRDSEGGKIFVLHSPLLLSLPSPQIPLPCPSRVM